MEEDSRISESGNSSKRMAVSVGQDSALASFLLNVPSSGQMRVEGLSNVVEAKIDVSKSYNFDFVKMREEQLKGVSPEIVRSKQRDARSAMLRGFSNAKKSE